MLLASRSSADIGTLGMPSGTSLNDDLHVTTIRDWSKLSDKPPFAAADGPEYCHGRTPGFGRTQAKAPQDRPTVAHSGATNGTPFRTPSTYPPPSVDLDRTVQEPSPKDDPEARNGQASDAPNAAPSPSRGIESSTAGGCQATTTQPV